MQAILKEGLAELGLEGKVPTGAPEQLELYGRRLLEKNQVMNLTAITQPEQVARLHMLDCAALLRCAPFPAGRLLDVGTGAGFPGLVLAILVPDLEVTLLDSLNKRLDWLNEMIQVLALPHVSTVHARAEEQSHRPGWRDSFHIVTSRAVAALDCLSELCLPYVRPGGFFWAMKSVDTQAETEQARPAIARLGGRLLPPADYTIPGSDVTHRLIQVEKTAPTPKGYPRKWAKIQKQPIR
ncbi:16S rRNA (guanine(527)-N(7))-methyltransferase RsmG [Pseudoflavonifractor sp. 524-17]|nr:16S rRNA (guanine(527)-N(7))-methyltransferase RsmG [Pseudoflavonifractor sp. 524-17]